jgi:uncharacterized membrane protein YjjP (DUF1212 family)
MIAATAEPAPTQARAVGAPARRAMALTVRLGTALHRLGAPSHRLEEAMGLCARRFGLDAQLFSLPTSIHAAFGPPGEQTVFLVRTEPGADDLERLALLDHLLDELAANRIGIPEAEAAVETILARPSRYGPGTSVAAFGLVSAGAARFLGGGLAEVLTALAIGLLSGSIALVAGRRPRLAPLQDAGSAALGAFVAAAVGHLLGPVSVPIATLAGLIVLVPGLTLTTAMTELATRHLASGTARLTGAFALFLAIGFGTALGWQLAAAAFGSFPAVAPIPLPGWTLLPTLVVSPLAIAVLLKAAPRDLPAIVAGGALAFAGARAGSVLLGPELGAMLGALLIGAGANLFARLARRPASVPFVPGLLLLVPGSLGFRSFAALLDHDVVAGLETAFRMVLVAMALVTGVLLANVLVPPRRSL